MLVESPMSKKTDNYSSSLQSRAIQGLCIGLDNNSLKVNHFKRILIEKSKGR